MINMIMSDPELMKNIIMLAIITPLAIVADRMSKKLPDFTEEEDEK